MKFLIFELTFLGAGKISITGKPVEAIRVGARLNHIELNHSGEGDADTVRRLKFGPAVVIEILTYGKNVKELDGGVSGQLLLELETGVRMSLVAE